MYLEVEKVMIYYKGYNEQVNTLILLTGPGGWGALPWIFVLVWVLDKL